MIIDIVLYLIGYLLNFISIILPTWTIWPQTLLDGFSYFASAFARLNFLLPINTLFNCLSFLIGFEATYLSVKLTMKLFNFLRGTGSGLDI